MRNRISNIDGRQDKIVELANQAEKLLLSEDRQDHIFGVILWEEVLAIIAGDELVDNLKESGNN